MVASALLPIWYGKFALETGNVLSEDKKQNLRGIVDMGRYVKLLRESVQDNVLMVVILSSSYAPTSLFNSQSAVLTLHLATESASPFPTFPHPRAEFFLPSTCTALGSPFTMPNSTLTATASQSPTP
jgi:hypothetical protein